MPEEICDNLDYFDYLMDRLKIGENKVTDYSELFMHLFRTVFIISHPEDDRRINDALYLRNEYFESDLMSNYPVSVLEVLVIFSERIETEYIGDPSNLRPYGIFLKMLENLDLLKFDNGNWDPIYANKILEKWMLRKYSNNGVGSPFPLTKSYYGYRERNMWDQMMAYINENWR